MKTFIFSFFPINVNDDLKFLSRDMLQTENEKKFWFSFFLNNRAQLQLNWKFNIGYQNESILKKEMIVSH